MHRRFAPHVFVLVLLAILGADIAHARTAVRLPAGCEVRSGRIVVRSGAPYILEVMSTPRRQVFSACTGGQSQLCRRLVLHKFDVACGDDRVPWIELAAALIAAKGGAAWIRQDRLHIRQPAPSQRSSEPCGTSDEIAIGRAFGGQRWQQEGCEASRSGRVEAPAWVLPPGFAPLDELGARLVDISDARPAERSAGQPTTAHIQEPTPGSGTGASRAGLRNPDARPPPAGDMGSPPATSLSHERPGTDPGDDEGWFPASASIGPAEERQYRNGTVVPSSGGPDGKLQGTGAAELRLVSVSGWSSSVSLPDREWVTQVEPKALHVIETVTARLWHLRPGRELTPLLLSLTLISGLVSGLGWYAMRARRMTRGPTPEAPGQAVMFRPTAGVPMPMDERMCTELSRTAHALLRQIDGRIDELNGAAPLRRVLQREMRNLEQFLTAVMTASPAESEEWRRLRNRLQRIVKELQRLQEIVEGACRSLSGAGFVDREPRDRHEAYEALGVNPDVSPKTLKKLVEALRACWHPDLAKDEADRVKREERMKRINIAWDIITERRQEA